MIDKDTKESLDRRFFDGHLPRLVAFDLDNTLSPNRGLMEPEMAARIVKLLKFTDVAIITGGSFRQLLKQFLDRLPAEAQTRRLHLLPTNGATYANVVHGMLDMHYSIELSEQEVKDASAALEFAAKFHGLWESKVWGDIIESRGTQVTFSGLGQQAPSDAKDAWDPDGSKKRKIIATAQGALPNLEVRVGGTTSVDVMKSGINKGYGMRRLSKIMGISPVDAWFLGDRLDEEGNDYPVIDTGALCIAVESPADTIEFVDYIISGFRRSADVCVYNNVSDLGGLTR